MLISITLSQRTEVPKRSTYGMSVADLIEKRDDVTDATTDTKDGHEPISKQMPRDNYVLRFLNCKKLLWFFKNSWSREHKSLEICVRLVPMGPWSLPFPPPLDLYRLGWMGWDGANARI